MFPIKDMNRSLTTPYVNRVFILINIVVFVVMSLSYYKLISSSDFVADIEERFAMRPFDVVQGERLYTLFTAMFLHASWLHLFGNMLFLYVFGDNVEDVFGHVSYFVFYIVCGLAAAFTHIISLTNIDPREVVVGASGAISGVLGAYFILYPRAKILTFIFPIIVPIPAAIFLGFWFLMQWLYAIFPVAGQIAYWAHVGGFIAGMILALVFGLKKKRAREARFRL